MKQGTQLNTNFLLKAELPNFDRDVIKTLEELKSTEIEGNYTKGHIVYCEEDDSYYRYTAEFSEDYGLFRPFFNAQDSKDEELKTTQSIINKNLSQGKVLKEDEWVDGISADEEDITSDDNNLLKLKDRRPINGMGYVILRKDKPFIEQLQQENTIYEIRYYFDLGFINKQNHTTSEITTLSYKTGGYYYKSDTAIIVDKCQMVKVPDGMYLIYNDKVVSGEYYNRTNSSVTLYAASDTKDSEFESLTMTFVDIPDGCILKFDGGSISNGRLYGDFEIFSKGVKIFNNVSFDGDCIHDEFNLDWFVANKNKKLDLSGNQKDSTEEIQMAFDSGITLLRIRNKFYYYVSSTIVAPSWLTIIGDARNFYQSRKEEALPCIYTDKDITVLQIVAQRKLNAPNSTSIRVEGFSIRRYGKTISQSNNFHYNISTVKVITGRKNLPSYSFYSYAWGVYIDLNLYSADQYIKLKKDGIEEFNAYMYGYTGIELYASDGNYLTYIEIKGAINGFRRAYYCHVDEGNSSWITDSRLHFDSIAVYGGDILRGAPIRLTGSHQPSRGLFADDEDKCYFKVKGSGVSTAMIWDLTHKEGNLQNVSYPFKKEYLFQDLETFGLSESWEDDSSVLPSNSIPIDRTTDYIHTLLNKSSNLLERIYNRQEGWRACDNVLDNPSEDIKSKLGTFNYARLYNSDGDYIDVNEATVHNYDSLLKLSSLNKSTSGVFYNSTSDTCTKEGVPTACNQYEVSFTLAKEAVKMLMKSYFVAICHNESSIDSFEIYSNENLLTKRKFDKVSQWRAESICVPFIVPSSDSDITLIVRGTINIGGIGRIIPKFGIMCRDTSNLITSSGGEIVGRLSLSDVMLNTNYRGEGGSSPSTRYLNNKFFKKNLPIKSLAPILSIQTGVNTSVNIEYITDKGRLGVVTFRGRTIVSADPYITFKLYEIAISSTTNTVQLCCQSYLNESITITSIYSDLRIKFLNEKGLDELNSYHVVVCEPKSEMIDTFIGFRKTGNDALLRECTARIKSIKGNTIVWNQQVEPISEATYKAYNTDYGVLTFNGNKAVLEVIQSPTNTYQVSMVLKKEIPLLKSHKYLYRIKAKASSELSLYFSANYSNYKVTTKEDYINIFINQKNDVSEHSFYLGIPQNTPVGEKIEFSGIAIYDLTLMFGAGNEPKTAKEFQSKMPIGIDEYAFNKGELISTKVERIKSIGCNAFNGKYARVLGGYNYKILGTYDSIGFSRTEDGEVVPIEVADGLYTPVEDGYIIAQGEDIIIHINSDNDDYECDGYWETSVNIPINDIVDSEGNPLFLNGLLSAGSVYDEINTIKAIKRVGVREYQDGDITTDGATTYYELPQPIEVYLEKPLNIVYDVSNLGTEEAYSQTPSSVLRADILYQYGAKDTERNNRITINDLLERVKRLEAQFNITN